MDAFVEFLKLNLLASQPQTFVYLLFCFSFLEVEPPKLLKRLAIFTFIHSVYTDAFILYLPLPLHLINSLFAALVLMFILFKDLKTKQKAYLILFLYVVFMSMDLLVGGILIYGLDVPAHANMIRENLFQMISLIYPLLIVTLLASWFIRKRNLFSAKRLFSIVIQGDRRPLATVIVFIVIQFFLLGVLQVIQFTPDRDNQTFNAVLIYVTIFISLLALVSIIRLLIRSREQAIRTTQEVYIEDINNMFTSIRGQRHDFLNHVQVIHSMVQMGKTEQLKAYVSDLVKETHEVSELVHHDSPALAAFVRAKLTVAAGRGIAFTYELPSEWNVQESSIKIIDIIKIMGNLVDNAFDETEHLAIEERRVHTSVKLESDTILITVSNNGRHLDPHERKQILQAGYTTKGLEHSGLGLAIVLERVRHYRGNLEVQSEEEKGSTLFRVTLPEA